MCFADSSVSVEIEEGDLVTEQYKCIDCNSKFRGIGKKVRCPSCQSANVEKV
jgi:predicted Zn-ribbon and HTH transcriptional regulator